MSGQAFVATIKDGDLRRYVRKVLLNLAMLSEAQAIGEPVGGGKGKGGKSTGSPPPETRLGQSQDSPPPRDRSLYEWHRWHLERAVKEGKDDLQIRRLAFQADGDYRRFTHHSPNLRKGKDTEDPSPEHDAEFADRIAEWYSGVSDEEVALVYENVRVEVVKKARRSRNLDHQGTVKEGWFTWDEDEKVRQIKILHEFRDWGQKKIADELGVSKTAIARRWPRITGDVEAA